MKNLLPPILLLFFSFCTAQSDSLTNELDQFAGVAMQELGIPGVALAVVKDGDIIHQQNYGLANVEHQVSIIDESIFRVYSLTKLMTTVGIFQLIEARKLQLEDRISKYLPDLPDAWKKIKIKHLLSHSSGLPDMSPIPEFQDLTEAQAIDKVVSQECSFAPGMRYDYNQTGFWLLKEIIETITEEELAAWILKRQFPIATDTAFFSCDSREIISNRVTAYFPFTKGYLTIDHPYLNGTYAYGLNGMNITLEAFLQWDQALQNNTLLDAETKAEMWKTFDYSNSDKVFTYGWDKHIEGERISYGFSGSLITAYRTFPEEKMSIIFLSNGLSQFYDIENLMDMIADIVARYY